MKTDFGQPIRGVIFMSHTVCAVNKKLCCASVFTWNRRISTKTECDCLYGWIKKLSHAKISSKVVNPRDIAGEHRTGFEIPTCPIARDK